MNDTTKDDQPVRGETDEGKSGKHRTPGGIYFADGSCLLSAEDRAEFAELGVYFHI